MSQCAISTYGFPRRLHKTVPPSIALYMIELSFPNSANREISTIEGSTAVLKKVQVGILLHAATELQTVDDGRDGLT